MQESVIMMADNYMNIFVRFSKQTQYGKIQ